MRQIDITDYTVSLPNPKAGEERKDGSEESGMVDVPYHFKESMIELLFARDNELNGMELLERDKLAHKIYDCSDGIVLLEENEWGKFCNALEAVKGLGRSDVEFVRRILKAEKVEVEAKK
ncbi:hypothetical protein ES703_35376 [subsurface metagenome]|jgi:hypothetical protein